MIVQYVPLSVTNKNMQSSDLADQTQTVELSGTGYSPIKSMPRTQKRENTTRLSLNHSLPRRKAAEVDKLVYVAQRPSEIPMQAQYERARLAEIARSRYFESEYRNSDSEEEEDFVRRRPRRKQTTRMPRVAILNESIEETMERNLPVLCVLSDKKKTFIQNRLLKDEKSEWPQNQLFPIRKKESADGGVITYERFRQKSVKEKQNMVQITRFWRENVDRYSRELQPH